MADTRTPTAAPDKPADPGNKFKVVDVRDRDVTLEMEDGRVFVAKLSDNVKLDDENAKRNRLAVVTMDGLDSSDAPKDAVITRFLPKE